MGIRSRIGDGEIHRSGAALDRHLEQIEVGRPGLGAPGDARGEHQRPAVGAEGESLIVPEGLVRNIGIEAPREVNGRAAGAGAGGERLGEQVRACTVAPGVPVADEHALVDARARLVLCPRVQPFPGAAERRAVGEDFHREGEQVTARRHLQRSDVERIVGHLLRLAAARRDAPDLAAPRARRDEVERATVRGPARTRVARLAAGQAARRCAARREIEQPEARTALVGVHVRLPLHEGELAAVGGELWVGDALESHQVVHGEGRAGACGLRRAACGLRCAGNGGGHGDCDEPGQREPARRAAPH